MCFPVTIGERVLKAFAQGIPGAQVMPIEAYSPPGKGNQFDVAVIYGDYKVAVENTRSKQRVIHGQHSAETDVIYVDSGYIDRGNGGYYSVGVNGMHGSGLPYWLNSPPNRWRALNRTIQPIQKRIDGDIILIGQVPWDANVQYTNHEKWLAETYYSLINMFDASRVKFRPHPKARHLEYEHIPDSVTLTQTALDDDLNTCTMIVTGKHRTY